MKPINKILATALVALVPAAVAFPQTASIATQAQEAYNRVETSHSEYDAKAAFDLASEGAAMNDGECVRLLGSCYLKGYGVDKNPSAAFAKFREAYDLGNLEAINNIGNCYFFGNGVAKDEKKALEWYRKGAEKEIASAMCQLGYFYDHGFGGLTPDFATAYEWFRKSAEKGYVLAMRNYGRMSYEEHKHIDGDFTTAIKWLTRAADQGNTMAMVDLGDVHSYFEGYPGEVTRYDLAIQWYLKAANAGYTPGMVRMAGLYFDGIENYLPKDLSQSEMWAKKAIESDPDNAHAYYILGLVYLEGDRTVAKDPTTARICLQKARDLGHEGAAYRLKKLDAQ